MVAARRSAIIPLCVPITQLVINTREWAQIASAKAFDATNTSILRVLRHGDGRMIVVGSDNRNGAETKGGEYLDVGGDVKAAVTRVATYCHVEALSAEVIAKL